MTQTETPSQGIMDRLRAETRDLHDAAEQHELQRNLGKGRLDRDLYIAYLRQLLLIHRALERGLDRQRQNDPEIARVIEDHQFQTPYLEEDLAFFGCPINAIEPVAATASLIRQIEADAEESPRVLLGYHYVLEGSNNGGRFIAKNVRVAYGLDGDAGMRYLDPYGERQRELWMRFKEAMGAVAFGDEECDAMVDRAKTMFGAIAGIGDELLANTTSSPSLVG